MTTNEATRETKKFDAEVSKVLNLMINSLYTNKDIFLRELISNASDACDKLRYHSQTDSSLLEGDSEYKINISIDSENRNLIITDNGIGMNRQELIDNIGTIASSGTQNFLAQMTGDAQKDNNLIGQFGVGFYSAFMVSDFVTVISKKAGEDKAWIWKSDGQGEYSLEETKSSINRGTEITLHIRDELDEYLDHHRIKHIVKTYSDHISVPIYLKAKKEGEEQEEEQINTSSALWKRPKSEISDEEYKEFYKNVAHAADHPWMILHNHNEGKVEFTNLLFIPSKPTYDLYHPDRMRRVKLYIKRVFIAEEGLDIVPAYMRFLRGMVDSEDLPLNISRETLQHNATLEKIKQSIVSRVLRELKKRLDKDKQEYLTFWDNFGAVLKEGLCETLSEPEKVLDVCLFHSALKGEKITLREYIDSMQNGQNHIYYLSGDDAEKLRNSPQIEGFVNKNIDVLLFTDNVDDFWVNVVGSYKEVEFKSATRSDIDLDGDDKSKENEKEEDKEDNQEDQNSTIQYIKEILGDKVKDVKASHKLTSSPVCLAVAEGAMDIRMEKFLREQNQLNSSMAKILEINLNHPIIQNLGQKVEADNKDESTEDLVKVLYDQACVMEGLGVEDAPTFSKRMNNIITKAFNS